MTQKMKPLIVCRTMINIVCKFIIPLLEMHNFWDCAPGSCTIFGIVHLDHAQFLGLCTWIMHNFWDCAPGSCTIFEIVHLDHAQFLGLCIWIMHNFWDCAHGSCTIFEVFTSKKSNQPVSMPLIVTTRV